MTDPANVDDDPIADADDAAAQALARALSSPLRLRVLRLCAFDARTNKEIAELLEVNPGTMLHHVRTLVDVGLLAPQDERIGTRGAREVPYIATGLSWRAPRMPNQSIVLLETMRQQMEGLDPESVETTWLGLRLNDEHLHELRERLYGLLQEFKERGPDAEGASFSLVTVLHPDRNPPAR
ncbi:helix-turn-helix domain-containing protein [Microbacterium sp. W1N]|uniref:ArsR/SmtB family transcription factor n=1 Tax=Microbacterium festucae TaxID=2977531 RepID=UPI0021C0CDBE|nr:helix-turn-helix domain-containing protein [Microbacterium festucae]MCT9819640.1 helix-turn-helix domain-containing protein [Microbacterium festucae]